MFDGFRLDLHIDLWNWLAGNPNSDKEDWPGWVKNGGDHHPADYCFACDYALGNCARCPLYWKGDSNNATCIGPVEKCLDPNSGLYSAWLFSRDNGVRKELALRIARLPLKPDWVIGQEKEE